MKNGTRIFLIVLIIVLMLGYIAAFTYCTVQKYASAEALDESTTIVEFNQYFNFESTPYGTIAVLSGQHLQIDNLSNNAYVNLSCPVVANHIYYFYCNNELNRNIELTIDGNPYLIFNSQYQIVTASAGGTCNRLYFLTGFNGGDYYFNLIDLTQMYGAERASEMSVADCQAVFKANSYSYTAGYPMYEGTNPYDLRQSIEYKFNTGNLTGYDYNITESKVTYNAYGQLVLSSKKQDNYSAYYLFNFKTSVPQGSIITINLNSYTSIQYSAIAFCYTDSDQTYITSVPYSNSENKPFNYSFVCNTEISALYIIIDPSGNAGTTYNTLTIYDGNISVQFSDDYVLNYEKQYDLGYQEATDYYTNGHGRQEIWSEGFEQGKARGLQEAQGTFTAMDYVKTALIDLGEILNIQVFPNFTLGSFFLLPIITSAIFFVIRIAKGGS